MQLEIELEKIVASPDPNIFFFDSFRVKKYNRSTYVLSGELTLKEQLDNGLDVLIIAYYFQGGQYKKFIERLYKKACTSLYIEENREQYEDIMKYSNIGPFGTCPHMPVSII